jgi:hypothetical protein
LFFNAGICPNWGPTTRIPFEMYVVINVYSKSRGILSRLSMPTKGGMYSGKTDEICFELARSSWCLLRFSVAVWLEQRPIEGDDCRAPVDDAYSSTDMN